KAYVSISEHEYLRFVGGLEGGGEARAPYPAGDAPLEAARRGIPRLVELAEGKQATDLLFGYHDRAGPRLWVKRICRDTGVPEITAHGMRGTHSTVALDSGKRRSSWRPRSGTSLLRRRWAAMPHRARDPQHARRESRPFWRAILPNEIPL